MQDFLAHVFFLILNCQSNVMKFCLSDGSKIIQCVAWEKVIPRIQKYIKPDITIHLTNDWANVAAKFYKGTVGFELSIKETTKLTVLKTEQIIEKEATITERTR
ncbi:uncharacterized protein LOC117173968 [Belonocnema kinseyi]|uniref:uncharacterized protein LOC117173968 n=1 Tax=Belonocnema kinseyi TaxID=2817044 RepID=UPI00143D811F|nr:uncharacterized protein LOC117173968 [Belonocnema kinseyi]